MNWLRKLEWQQLGLIVFTGILAGIIASPFLAQYVTQRLSPNSDILYVSLVVLFSIGWALFWASLIIKLSEDVI